MGMRGAMMMKLNGAIMMQAGGIAIDPNNQPVTRDVNHNQLVCIDAETGRTRWTLGRGKTALDNCYFLAPPLPLNGKLYALIEKEQELRLICIEPGNGKIAWTQALANFSKGINQEVGRRTWAAHLAYGEGVLVCPSHSGAVVAVDLLSHSLLWAHSYAKSPPPEKKQARLVGNRVLMLNQYQPFMPRLAGNWKNSAPIIADGKVLVTAPDANVLHCLNLRDGSLLWKTDWTTDDCYVAGVIDGKVLMVSKQACRAFSLADGKALWITPTGLPCGHGVAAGKLYCLPMRDSSLNPLYKQGIEEVLKAHKDVSKEAGVSTTLNGFNGVADGFSLCAIDMSTGKIVQRTALPQSSALGNLLLYQGRLVSQTANNISAFAAQ
jgi:outer membrane protein assembly factor BamB